MKTESTAKPVRAAVCREFKAPLSLETVFLSPPQAGEAQVKLSACAICHSDLMYMDGAWGGNLPTIFGHEAAGVVTAVGPGVDPEIAPGVSVLATLLRSCGRCALCESGRPSICARPFAIDREPRLRGGDGEPIYAGLRVGAFAEEIVVDSSQVVASPPGLPPTEGCLLSCGVLTGVGAALNTAQVEPGASVAVVGCGGVGLNCAQGAAIAGADPIVAIDTVESKLQTAIAFGATDAFLAGDSERRARALAEGGFDYVFAAAAGAAAVEAAAGLVALGGALILVGMAADDDLARIDATAFANRGRRILGSKMGGGRLRVDIPKLARWRQSGRLKLRELIGETFEFSRINDAVASARRDGALRNVLLF